MIFANTVRAIHERVPGARVEILSGDYRGDLARARHRDGRAARRLRAQSRNRAPPHADACATSARATISRSRCSRTRRARAPRTLHEDVADARPRRDRRRDRSGDGRRARRRRRHLHDGAVPAADQEASAGRRVRHAARAFARLGELARSKGFHQVVSSPLSRSSYHAEQAFLSATQPVTSLVVRRVPSFLTSRSWRRLLVII